MEKPFDKRLLFYTGLLIALISIGMGVVVRNVFFTFFVCWPIFSLGGGLMVAQFMRVGAGEWSEHKEKL